MKEFSRSPHRRCPGCGGSSFTAGPNDRLICNYCGNVYSVPRDEPGMGTLEPLFARVTGTPGDWLRDVREEATAIKNQEGAASQARLTAMWALETKRREALARAQAQRERQMQAIWIATAVVIGLLLLIFIAVIALNSVPGPQFYPRW